jgi:hypothetical protein
MDIKKIIAKLPTGFVEDAAGMDGDGLRAAIVRAEERCSVDGCTEVVHGARGRRPVCPRHRKNVLVGALTRGAL